MQRASKECDSINRKVQRKQKLREIQGVPEVRTLCTPIVLTITFTNIYAKDKVVVNPFNQLPSAHSILVLSSHLKKLWSKQWGLHKVRTFGTTYSFSRLKTIFRKNLKF